MRGGAGGRLGAGGRAGEPVPLVQPPPARPLDARAGRSLRWDGVWGRRWGSPWAQGPWAPATRWAPGRDGAVTSRRQAEGQAVRPGRLPAAPEEV